MNPKVILIEFIDDPEGVALARRLGAMGHIVYGLSAAGASSEGGYYVVDADRPGEVVDEVLGREGRLDGWMVRGEGEWPMAWAVEVAKALNQQEDALLSWDRSGQIPEGFVAASKVLQAMGLEG